MESIWQKNGKLPSFPALSEDLDTDILVIGGGMAGLLCAHSLHHAGADYVLVEADRIASAVTGRTTAKITVLQGLLYYKLPWQKAHTWYLASKEAVGNYRKLCQELDCDFEEQPAFVYSRDTLQALEREFLTLQTMGADVSLVKEPPLPFPVAGALRLEGQGQFHPLKFLAGITPKLHIFENTPVTHLEGTTAITPRGKIRAKRVVVATHFPMFNRHGLYFMKLYQHRSYVLALSGAKNVEGMYVSQTENGLSFRNWGELLLLGGGGHRTGKPGGGFTALREAAKQYFPGAKVEAFWATQDCMSLDGLPYIGAYSSTTPDVYVSTGFNKWGMTGSMVGASVLTDLLQGKKSPYEDLLSPSRSMLRPQLAANAAEAIAGWLTPGKRCPHLGCRLHWNPQEHSWDCPCHGSRFTKEGKLLENPATGDLKGADS